MNIATSLDTKLWIYQISRKVDEQESSDILEKTNAFLGSWKAHGKPLSAKAHILHDLFLIIELDSTAANASGCSIDAMVKFLKELEADKDFTFFDRERVSFLQNDKVIDCSVAELQEIYESGNIDNDTIFFNTLIDKGSDWDEKWKSPLKDSWQKRLI